ncbi:nucleoside 2-deoxyribosyltransferase [Bacillus carboniphilus]|uniref:Nucleoside 2-deoxyribosyltransferase n=1 Tax=Bacillus carboniphilus TaxID=86663 RepID=A0ABY9JS13_9BACI|nr:nucleoside 2-deoxyribosyltransferase [Bacillus carboniphilus]WLR42176.1 nucleoside 2-deoxyribosyltransferase [Bacillus carboniphilus]
MKFYIASSFQNKQQVIELSSILKENGHFHTYDWTKNQRANSLKALTEIGEAEKQAVLDCDLFILLLPGGIGSHVELGMALALKKTIYIYAPSQEYFDFENTTTFYHDQGVQIVTGPFHEFIRRFK